MEIDLTQTVTRTLLTLKSETEMFSDNPKEFEIKALMSKFDMLILGEKFNTIYSNELCNYISKTFNITVDIDSFNELIPPICKSLNMVCSPMFYLSELQDGIKKLACYSIELR
jgi:hypothetical protein